MKKLIKILAVTLCCIISLSVLPACGGGGKSNATVLKIGVFNGGLGYKWAEDLAIAFEEKYEGVSFEPGKEGVDVQINPQKDLFKVESIKSAISNNSNAEDIYYTCYEFFKEFAKEGLALNITDVVDEKVYLDNGELADMTYNPDTKKYELAPGAVAPTKSMSDKMTDFFKDSYYMTTKHVDFTGDGIADIPEGYYALPYETSISGFIYDYDLFEEQGWLDYDGVDGVPDTMEDFKDLLERIEQANMIAYTGKYGNYYYGWRAGYIAQYEGFENAALNYTFDGEYTFNADSVQIINQDYPTALEEEVGKNRAVANTDGSYTVTIVPENAWLLIYQPSKAKYVEDMRDIVDSRFFLSELHEQSYDYEMIQQGFVWSKLEKEGAKRIAMIHEGEWWENEARSFFNITGGYGSRDFRFMPTPYIEGQFDEDVRSFGAHNAGTHLIVNGRTKQAELCRLWLQFSHSESALEKFTLTNGAVRDAFEYDLSDEQLQELTPFGRNVYNIKTNKNDNIEIYRASAYLNAHDFSVFNPMGGFEYDIWTLMSGKHGSWDAIGSSVFSYFFAHAGDVTDNYVSAEEYLYGDGTTGGTLGANGYYNKEYWETTYKTWFTTQI